MLLGFSKRKMSEKTSTVWLTSSAPSHKAQVVEAGHLVLHHGRSVPQLG